MQYTNNSNLSLAVQVFLASDDYDHEPNTISATSLMRSARQYILSKRIPANENFIDISSLVSSRMGTAIHSAIEKAWENPTQALKNLGYPKRVYENIIINPTKEELSSNPKAIPIYMEQRSYKDIMGFKVSGKFDFIGEGIIQDFKSTSVWNYLNQTNVSNYQTQLSIYRWLNPELVTKDYGLIHYFFTDWSAAQERTTKGYPSARVFTQKVPLLTLQETEAYVRSKLSDIIKYMDKPESDIPHCTDEDLWRKDPVWKYYKNPEKTSRSTKNFDSKSEALRRFVEDGNVGLVQEVPGQAVRCKYCPAFAICTQKDQLITKGELTL